MPSIQTSVSAFTSPLAASNRKVSRSTGFLRSLPREYNHTFAMAFPFFPKYPQFVGDFSAMRHFYLSIDTAISLRHRALRSIKKGDSHKQKNRKAQDATPKGRIIKSNGKPFYRIYTTEMLQNHFHQFSLEQIQYHALEPHGWMEVSQSVAEHIDHTEPYTPCIANIVARKKGDR